MNSFTTWLNNHKYELLSECLYKDRILRIRETITGSKKLLKILDMSELESKVVDEVVETMNKVNSSNIRGLLKYKIIEMNEKSLYRVMREYKTHLDIISPMQYFEESGPFGVLNGILNVLKGLHENGTIHSDLKPSNIFLNDENEVIISDYYNYLLYKGREEMIKIDGRDLCFVCIDELLGKELDISSDIWNFGLVFYYIVSGKYPFLGSNMLETMKNIENVKYIPLECENGDKLNSFLRRILVKEKNGRLTLNEVIAELKKLNKAELPVIPFEQEEEIKFTELNKGEGIAISKNGKLITNIFYGCDHCYLNLKMENGVYHIKYKYHYNGRLFDGIFIGLSTNNIYSGDYIHEQSTTCNYKAFFGESEDITPLCHIGRVVNSNPKFNDCGNDSIYEVIVDMNKREFWISHNNSSPVLLVKDLPSPLYPYIEFPWENTSCELLSVSHQD